jgi:hypothetical protein
VSAAFCRRWLNANRVGSSRSRVWLPIEGLLSRPRTARARRPSAYFESLRIDLRHTGVGVTIIHPGFIKTALTSGREAKMPYLMELDTASKRSFQRSRKGKEDSTLSLATRNHRACRHADAAWHVRLDCGAKFFSRIIMTILQAIFLGLVQGLTEFIPVSSTAHLVFAARVVIFTAALIKRCRQNRPLPPSPSFNSEPCSRF